MVTVKLHTSVCNCDYFGKLRLHFFTDVRNLSITEITHDTIVVMWDAVPDRCVITYNVTISTANGHLIDSFVIRSNQFTFMDLMSNTSYIVTVFAANQHGDGRTATINVTTGLVPPSMYIHDCVFKCFLYMHNWVKLVIFLVLLGSGHFGTVLLKYSFAHGFLHNA